MEHRTFSGEYAVESGQEVMYITERAVFRLDRDGLVLVEKAPGVDLERDILGQMDFRPTISPGLKDMDPGLFGMSLLDLPARLSRLDGIA